MTIYATAIRAGRVTGNSAIRDSQDVIVINEEAAVVIVDSASAH